MEKWNEVYKDIIPNGKYNTKIENGDKNGLVITLENEQIIVSIEFGIVSAVRMLDEGIIVENLFKREEILKYKKDNFSNCIYKIENGEFSGFLNKIDKNLSVYLNLTYYIVVTMNYVVEVASEWEPKIKVLKK